MFKCESCGNTFDEPGLDYERHYELDGAPKEYYSSCPTCGSGDIAEGGACPLCGGFTEGSYCEECEESLRERFTEILKAEFTEEELLALDKIYEDKSILEGME